ncbi:MAG: hypothetical protein OXI94_02610 [Gemmatimonadota bacterium]|nr:hypothetical protein [Gemmatimonadota bacterium]MDE2954655.1 hypothetical protein [Gemmatimonadota bacterium]
MPISRSVLGMDSLEGKIAYFNFFDNLKWDGTGAVPYDDIISSFL